MLDVNELDQGIRGVVLQLRAAGFETCDSGDGVSKPADWFESGDALPYPHVFAMCPLDAMVAESHRMQELLGEAWRVEVTYAPDDGTAVLMATQQGKEDRP